MTPLSLPGFDPIQFLCKLDGNVAEPVFVRMGRWMILSWNPSGRVTWKKRQRWNELRSLMRSRHKKTRGDVPFVGGLIGYGSYDLGYGLHGIEPHAKDMLDLPLLSLGIYEYALCYDGEHLIAVGPSSFIKEATALHYLPLPVGIIAPITFTPQMTRHAYAKAFNHIHRAILTGDVYQMNLTYFLRARGSHNLAQLFALLCRRHPAPRAAYVVTPETTLLSLSPEEFVSLRGGYLRTCPIKGTRRRGETKLEDRRMREELLESAKEQAELHMITDLLRNDLGRVAVPGSVAVTEQRRMEKFPSIWHTSSVIEATLAQTYSAVDVLHRMLPGGSITGCPKARAMELIDSLESIRRGPYTGTIIVLGDDGSLESSILIRTAIAKGKHLWVGIGGGIVHDSTVAEEYEETRRKAAPFLALAQPQILYRFDGRKATADDPRLAALDGGNADAIGVFETLLLEHGSLCHLEEHLQRLKHSAALTGLKLPARLSIIRSQVKHAAKDCPWPLARVKVVCTPRHILLRMEEMIFDCAAQQSGAAVTCVRLQRKIPGAKALPYHRETAAHRRALCAGFGEALLLAADGRIPEGAFSNIFWIERGTLCTPNQGMLEGIVRNNVLLLAKRHKIPVRFHTPTVDLLTRADEVFLTRSTAGIIPVIRIDHHRIADGGPGPVTRLLQSEI